MRSGTLFRTRHHLGRQRVAVACTRQLRSQGLVPVHAHRTEWVIGFGDENGDDDVNGDGNEDGIWVGGGELKERKKLHKSCRCDQALYSARVTISADSG